MRLNWRELPAAQTILVKLNAMLTQIDSHGWIEWESAMPRKDTEAFVADLGTGLKKRYAVVRQSKPMIKKIARSTWVMTAFNFVVWQSANM
jgi:hypothetical protein